MLDGQLIMKPFAGRCEGINVGIPAYDKSCPGFLDTCWRTPALYQIADIQFRQSQWEKATALFERVAVTQQKYPAWAARAYNKAADGYRKMGKDGVAKERLKEMLGKEKFQTLPEAEEARKKLAELGGTA